MTFYEYLQAYDGYFWSWQDDAEVACLTNGSTIAYREFLIDTLELLAEQQLPPFGALLLAVTATNKSVVDGVDWLQTAMLQDVSDSDKECVEQAIAFLRILQQLPTEYNEGHKRIQVFQVLFQNCHNNLGIGVSKDIVKDVKRFAEHHKGNLLEKLNRTVPYNLTVFRKDFRAIELMHRHFRGTVDIINAVAGLPEVDEKMLPIEENLQETANPPFSKDIVNELMADDKTFHIGALIPRIWSGLQIPFHHSLPSQQPLGGVSDLSNKGDFDRLLISEFANDDMVLMSRLANNEALYLQREIPPSKNEEERILLIDVSIRNWGTPKLMAFAIALAVSRYPKTDIPCRIFCVGNDCTPIVADNMSQLIDSLMLMSEGLHAATGLEQFFAVHAGNKKKELFFIGTAAAMAYAPVQKVINDYYAWFKYWVTVEQDGSIELYRNQHHNKKFIQHIQLPLEVLWANKPNKPNKAPNNIDELPNEYPLLFPWHTKYKQRLYTVNDGYFVVDNERTLLKYYGDVENVNQKGLQVVMSKLPKETTDFAIGKHSEGHYEVLCFNRAKREVTIINLSTKKQHLLSFPQWSAHPHPDFFYFQDSFWFRPYNVNTIYCLQYNQEQVLKKEGIEATEAAAAYKLIMEEQAKRLLREHDSGSLLKNVTTVYIDDMGNLVLGKHELVLNSHVIKWSLATNVRRKVAIAQVKESGRLFEFLCGSTVQINRSGMAILRKGFTDTDDRFDILLENSGASPIMVIKVIRSITVYSLAQAKDRVDSTPCQLGFSCNEAEAQEAADKLRDAGATVRVVATEPEQVMYIPLVLDSALGVATDKCFAGNNFYYVNQAAPSLAVIEPYQFFARNIQSFTQQIVKHGT